MIGGINTKTKREELVYCTYRRTSRGKRRLSLRWEERERNANEISSEQAIRISSLKLCSFLSLLWTRSRWENQRDWSFPSVAAEFFGARFGTLSTYRWLCFANGTRREKKTRKETRRDKKTTSFQHLRAKNVRLTMLFSRQFN